MGPGMRGKGGCWVMGEMGIAVPGNMAWDNEACTAGLKTHFQAPFIYV